MIPKYKPLTKAQKRDFLCYVKLAKQERVGQTIPLTTSEPAKNLAHWFVLWDTHGIVAPYHHQKRCWRLVQAKSNLNLTIALWLEDAFHVHGPNGPFFHAEELYGYAKELPKWVWKAYVNQFKKMNEDIGVPSFVNPTLLDENGKFNIK